MYHSISDSRESGTTPYYRTVTTPRRFAEQMRSLSDSGYRGVTLSEGLEWLDASALSDRPPTSTSTPVVLTFDDGFRDFLTGATPALQKYRFNATMFLPTAFIAKTHTPHQFNGHDCLTWYEVRQLQAAGTEFGSHTVNHPKLANLSWPKIKAEICDSKSEIEQQMGCAAPTFAYPYAFPQADAYFVSRFREVLQQAGHQACVTTEIGRAKPGGNRFRLKRLPVNDADDPELLAAKLGGAYDWLARPQSAMKVIKKTLLSQ